MEESTAHIRAIAESWDDPLPLLVFADWAEERGCADPQLLRWYAKQVMPMIGSIPAACPPAPTSRRDRARKTFRSHPDNAVLSQLAAVAFCRRPIVWARLPPTPGRQAVTFARLAALGLATAAEKKDLMKASVSAEREARSRLNDLHRQFASLAQADEATKSVGHEFAAHHLARLLIEGAGHAVARCAYRFATDYESVLAEMGYQMAVYDALAQVPSLTADRQPAEWTR